MPVRVYFRRTRISASAAELFRWHERPGAFARLTPPWEKVRLISQSNGIRDGSRVVLETSVGPFSPSWEIEHRDYVEGRQFRDAQIRGPFGSWSHLHRMEEDTSASSWLEDRIEYALPLAAFSQALLGRWLDRKLDRMFTYRHDVTARDLALHARYRFPRPQKILLSGASGLIGSALSAFLTTGGHTVVPLVRRPVRTGENAVSWNPERGELDGAAVENFDAVIHLAGRNIAGARWTESEKRRLIESRVLGTKLLAETLARLENPPRVFISASAAGYYGYRTKGEVTESAHSGDDFLARLVKDWEEAARPAAARGIRLVQPRLAVVLSPAGGALTQMLLPFRLGAGGPLAGGRYPFPWVSLDDVLASFLHIVSTESLQGPVNIVSPQTIEQRDFARILGAVLRRPAWFNVPKVILSLRLGSELAASLLGGPILRPDKLLASGFSFSDAELQPALRRLLGR